MKSIKLLVSSVLCITLNFNLLAQNKEIRRYFNEEKPLKENPNFFYPEAKDLKI